MTPKEQKEFRDLIIRWSAEAGRNERDADKHRQTWGLNTALYYQMVARGAAYRCAASEVEHILLALAPEKRQ